MQRLLLVTLALTSVAMGCRTTATVEVDVREDGSGRVAVTVVVDGEAARALGGPGAIALDDLRATGWDVVGPEATPDGGLRVGVHQDAASPEDLQRLLIEVGGVDGVFRDVEVAVADGFASTGYRFRTRVEVTGELTQFSDPQLAASLGGVAVGWTPEELEAAGATEPDAGELILRVRLPGGADPAPGGGNDVERDGEWAVWSLPLSGSSSVEVVAESSVRDTLTVALLVGGAVLLVLAGALGVAALRRR
jgi:hypothetical protein